MELIPATRAKTVAQLGWLGRSQRFTPVKHRADDYLRIPWRSESVGSLCKAGLTLSQPGYFRCTRLHLLPWAHSGRRVLYAGLLA